MNISDHSGNVSFIAADLRVSIKSIEKKYLTFPNQTTWCIIRITPVELMQNTQDRDS